MRRKLALEAIEKSIRTRHATTALLRVSAELSQIALSVYGPGVIITVIRFDNDVRAVTVRFPKIKPSSTIRLEFADGAWEKVERKSLGYRGMDNMFA